MKDLSGDREARQKVRRCSEDQSVVRSQSKTFFPPMPRQWPCREVVEEFLSSADDEICRRVGKESVMRPDAPKVKYKKENVNILFIYINIIILQCAWTMSNELGCDTWQRRVNENDLRSLKSSLQRDFNAQLYNEKFDLFLKVLYSLTIWNF